MYQCRTCGVSCGPRMPLLKHVVYRRNPQWGPLTGTIMGEIPVCKGCKYYLDTGGSAGDLLRRNKLVGSVPSFVYAMAPIPVPVTISTGNGKIPHRNSAQK